MATEVIMVVGKNPLDDKFGFDAVGTMRHGTFIPDKLADGLVDSLLMDESAGSVVLTLASGTNDLGTTAGITLASGATIDLTGVAGVYTAGTPSTTFTDLVVAKIDGVQNMLIGALGIFSSGGTTSSTTIDVVLDQATTTEVTASNWTVEIDGTTNNVVTDVAISGTTVTITVTDAITVGQTITVSHTRTNYIAAMTDQTVTNNEA